MIAELAQPRTEDHLREALDGKSLVLYDGVCGLCNKTVQFTLKRDKANRFRFAPLQGWLAGQILRRHGLNSEDLNTVFVVERPLQEGEKLYKKSKAVFTILNGIGGAWKLVSWMRALPLNWAYDFVARNRYRWFGKYDACPLPSKEERAKFVGLEDTKPEA